jgi:hypothetical protein
MPARRRSSGGVRYDPSLSQSERSSIENAIWLCSNCGRLVDRDEARYTVQLLKEWKQRAENRASVAIGRGSQYRPIAPNEVIQELSVGELVIVEALKEEFGCHVEINARVPTGGGGGWLRLDAAVVRGEELIAVQMYEVRGSAIPYYQVEYLSQLCSELKFDRFKKAVLYVALVSNQADEIDEEVKARLKEIEAKSPCEFHLRMYRLNTLRAKYGL